VREMGLGGLWLESFGLGGVGLGGEWDRLRRIGWEAVQIVGWMES
jgi:hypothetical protein